MTSAMKIVRMPASWCVRPARTISARSSLNASLGRCGRCAPAARQPGTYWKISSR